jgi:asparagine synthase (glutamine-hydrolysing)
MCGIVGIAALGDSRPPAREQLQRMCTVLRHRGPDDEGIDIREGIGFGNRRLAVIDIEGGGQPVFNEDSSVRAIQNGEIYNFRNLQRQLEQRGHRFNTNCDTEVIVHAYEEYGVDFVDHLNGMFALAVHDAKNGRLLLARDHLGIKPLYYAWVDDKYLVWGSEIKALLASGLVRRDLNIDAVGQFLSWEYVPGRETLFKGIYELEPAELLVLDLPNTSARRNKYWDLPEETSVGSENMAEAERRVADKVKECVQRQLVSDVPLGVFLSGGVDSSLVAANMGSARAFSIGFDDGSYNELPYAKRVAEHLGAEHVYDVLSPDVAELFGHLVEFLDDPIGDFSIFPTFLLSKLTRQHVTVALSGDGGDELFGGYETYAAERYAHWYSYLPERLRTSWMPALTDRLPPSRLKKGTINKVKRFVEGAAYPESLGHSRWRLFASDLLKDGLVRPEARAQMETPTGAHIMQLFEQAGSRPSLDRQLYVDLRSYLVDNCLVKVDRMSMSESLEVRVPLLDRELVELAFELHPNLKLRGRETKAVLKRVAAKQIPRECVYRPKEGFSMPMKHWLNTELREVLEEFLSPAKVRETGVFQSEMVESLKDEHLRNIANHSHILWSLIVFQAWHDRWLGGDSAGQSFAKWGLP